MSSILDINTLCMGCMSIKENAAIRCPKCGFDLRTAAQDPHQLKPNTILNGKYLVGRVLGEGGFGITYLGWDLNLDIKIAIKEYYPSGLVSRENTASGSPTVMPFTGGKRELYAAGLEKFVREAKSLAKFYTLPGIVAVKDFFRENGTAYIVMEFVNGITLKQHLVNSGGKLRPNEVFELMRPLMKSLKQVHDEGIIHRDISPDNIMLTNKGEIKLLDFGAARDFIEESNKSISVLLKPGYAPEEQYRVHGRQGPWTDVYALSATIYKMITGKTPPESLERYNCDELVIPSKLGVQLSPQTESALLKGLAVFQRDRYQSIEALYDDIYGTTQGFAYAKGRVQHAVDGNIASVTIEKAVKTISKQGSNADENKAKPRRKGELVFALLQLASVFLIFGRIGASGISTFTIPILLVNTAYFTIGFFRKKVARSIETIVFIAAQGGAVLWTLRLMELYQHYYLGVRSEALFVYILPALILLANSAYAVFKMARDYRKRRSDLKSKKIAPIASLAIACVMVALISISSAKGLSDQIKQLGGFYRPTIEAESNDNNAEETAPANTKQVTQGTYSDDNLSFDFPKDWILSTNDAGLPLITGLDQGLQYQLSVLAVTDDTSEDIFDYTVKQLKVEPMPGGMGSVGNYTIGSYSGVMTGCLYQNGDEISSLTLYCITDGKKRIVIETRLPDGATDSNYNDQLYQDILATLKIF